MAPQMPAQGNAGKPQNVFDFSQVYPGNGSFDAAGNFSRPSAHVNAVQRMRMANQFSSAPPWSNQFQMQVHPPAYGMQQHWTGAQPQAQTLSSEALLGLQTPNPQQSQGSFPPFTPSGNQLPDSSLFETSENRGVAGQPNFRSYGVSQNLGLNVQPNLQTYEAPQNQNIYEWPSVNQLAQIQSHGQNTLVQPENNQLFQAQDQTSGISAGPDGFQPTQTYGFDSNNLGALDANQSFSGDEMWNYNEEDWTQFLASPVLAEGNIDANTTIAPAVDQEQNHSSTSPNASATNVYDNGTATTEHSQLDESNATYTAPAVNQEQNHSSTLPNAAGPNVSDNCTATTEYPQQGEDNFTHPAPPVEQGQAHQSAPAAVQDISTHDAGATATECPQQQAGNNTYDTSFMYHLQQYLNSTASVQGANMSNMGVAAPGYPQQYPGYNTYSMPPAAQAQYYVPPATNLSGPGQHNNNTASTKAPQGHARYNLEAAPLTYQNQMNIPAAPTASAVNTNTAASSTLPTSNQAAPVTAPNTKSKDDVVLEYSCLRDAMAAYDQLEQVKIRNNDWRAVEQNPIPWVKAIAFAYEPTFIRTPRENKLANFSQERWTEYQETHVARVKHFVGLPANEGSVERAAWKVYGFILDTHKNGYKPLKNKKFNPTGKKCSAHMQEVINAMADYVVIRYDILRGMRLPDIILNPPSAIARKLACYNGNIHKKERDEENARAAEEAGHAYNNVLGTRRRSTGGNAAPRSRRSRPSNFEDGEEDEDDEVEEGQDGDAQETPASPPASATASPTAPKRKASEADLDDNDEDNVEADTSPSRQIKRPKSLGHSVSTGAEEEAQQIRRPRSI